MKKYLYLGLLILLTLLIAPAFSSAQIKDNSIKLKIGEETGYIPAFNNLNIKLLSITQPLCKMAPCPKMVTILVSNKYIQTTKPIIYNLNEGDNINHDVANIKVSAVDEYGATFVILDAKNPSQGSDSQGIKDVVGTSFILTSINGECPENHLISDDGKTCIKLDTKIPIAPLEGSKDKVGVSFSPPTPVNGECPDGYAVSKDGKECQKVLPKIIIAPKEGFKEVIFESGGKTTIKDNNAKKEAVVTSKDGFSVVVSIKSEEEMQAKKVTIESRVSSGETNISVGQIISASTKESIEVKENKIFLNQKEVKVMPDEAKNTAITSAKLFSVATTELKTEEQKPVYTVQGVRSSKLLFFIPVSLETTTKIDATSGNVISIQKPWWSFLTW